MTARAAAASLARAVLGAGLILMPPVAFGLAGRYAAAAWLAHLAAGVAVAVVTGLLGRAAGAGNIAEVTGRALGRRATTVIYLGYLAGFTAGQAVIAMTAARLADAGLTGRAYLTAGEAGPAGLAAAGIIAAGIIAAATVAAAAGVRFGDRARAVRLLATVLLAGLACAWPALYRASGLLAAPAGFTAGSVVFLLLFAGVGWETMTRIGPSLPGRRSLVRAVLVGGAAVGAVYLALAALLAARAGAAAAPAWLRAGTGLGAAALLLLYCVGNIDTAAGFLAAVGGPAGVPARATVGAAAAVIAVLADRAAVSPQALLIAPCCAAWTGYLLATAAAVRARVISRRAGLAVLAVLLAMPLVAMA